MSEILSITKQDNRSPRSTASDIGQLGETFAARFLRKNGYRIVLANFKVPIGRNRKGVSVSGEIDLIALDEDILCFIEVKTRRSDDFASPLASVDLRKQRQITRTARIYRKIFHLEGMKFRYDALSVLIKKGKRPESELFKGFWTENKFRKRAWTGEF
jgi:putative endonuclease